jgi:hypothetical protein
MPHFDGITWQERRKMTFRSQRVDGRAGGIVPKTHTLGRVRIVVLSAFAVFLTWLVVRQSFAAYFAYFAPETALWLQPQQPLALVNMADQTLAPLLSQQPSSQETSDQTSARREDVSAKPSGSSEKPNNAGSVSEKRETAASEFETVDQNRSVNPKFAADDSETTNNSTHPPVVPQATATEVRAWAMAALMHDPLNARALRILGQLEAADKDYGAASKFMSAAVQLSLHENIAAYWSMLAAAQAKDYKTTTYYADVLLRTLPQSDQYVVPILAKIAEDKGSSALVEAALDKNPPWRRRFFAALPNGVDDARTPLSLLLGLKSSPMPPTSDEVAPYIRFLIARKLYDLAYYTWLQFLPVEELRGAGLLFNGNFDVAPSGLPFDWVITPGSGVTVDIVPRPDSSGKHALLLDFAYGRVDYQSVRQLVMLAPGTYEFKGQYKGQLVGPRGLKWRIECATGPTIEESPMIIGMMPSWRTFTFTFTVPATDCRAQYVRLDLDARTASEQLVSGSMLFDELQISRVANPS